MGCFSECKTAAAEPKAIAKTAAAEPIAKTARAASATAKPEVAKEELTVDHKEKEETV